MRPLSAAGRPKGGFRLALFSRADGSVDQPSTRTRRVRSERQGQLRSAPRDVARSRYAVPGATRGPNSARSPSVRFPRVLPSKLQAACSFLFFSLLGARRVWTGWIRQSSRELDGQGPARGARRITCLFWPLAHAGEEARGIGSKTPPVVVRGSRRGGTHHGPSRQSVRKEPARDRVNADGPGCSNPVQGLRNSSRRGNCVPREVTPASPTSHA